MTILNSWYLCSCFLWVCVLTSARAAKVLLLSPAPSPLLHFHHLLHSSPPPESQVLTVYLYDPSFCCLSRAIARADVSTELMGGFPISREWLQRLFQVLFIFFVSCSGVAGVGEGCSCQGKRKGVVLREKMTAKTERARPVLSTVKVLFANFPVQAADSLNCRLPYGLSSCYSGVDWAR